MDKSLAQRTFRHAVTRRRQALGLSQRQLCERLASEGVRLTQSALAKVERGEREPKIDEVAAIARVLRFSVDTLIVLSREEQVAQQIEKVSAAMAEARAASVSVAAELTLAIDLIQQELQLSRPKAAYEACARSVSVYDQAHKSDDHAIVRAAEDSKAAEELTIRVARHLAKVQDDDA
ncbi:helix-turn-helix domain-containing protein [Gordonia amicalis]|uniref:helix-turn-helix domain-containing protein n=1 Tax=Gordonia amicalis TaxID=89053 RepID=UPI0009DF4E78|nr:helix-turn-helix transcriptional regulator [Gordonia amicalis]